METSAQIESLLVELVIESEDYNLVQWLVQYHIIKDDLTLATRFLSLVEVFPAMLQFAIDMCFRLKAYPQILEIYCERGLVYQALSLIKNYSIKNGLQVQVLLQGINHPEANCARKHFVQFFQEYQKQMQFNGDSGAGGQ